MEHESVSDVEYAGFWLRVAAAIIDIIILWVPTSIFDWVFGGSQRSDVGFLTLSGFQTIVIWTLYYGFMESSHYQGTIGKIVLGLKVIDINGNRLSFGRSAIRYLAQILSALILGIGFFMAGWTQKKQALHDIITESLVIKAHR